VSLEGTFILDVVKPDGEVLSEQVDECVVAGETGSFGVRRGHTPFITQVGSGEIMYRIGDNKHYLAVEGGFCEVRPHRVTVLAERAERSNEIDVARATRARDRAAEHYASVAMTGDPAEIDRVRSKLRRAELRLTVASK
jgi:F-type H+-transporting ATPase subunit epsilon